jgi:hypothetical protein
MVNVGTACTNVNKILNIVHGLYINALFDYFS